MDKARLNASRVGFRQRRELDIAFRLTHKHDTTRRKRGKSNAKPQVDPRYNPPGLKNADGA